MNRRISEVIEKQKPFTATSRTTVVEAAKLMQQHKVGALMVVDNGRLTGIFTERDALFRVLAKARDPMTTHIGDVMTSKPRTVTPDKAIGYALLLMYEGGFRHVPVVDHGKPIGMVSARDALGPELQQFESELMNRDHISTILG